MIYYIFKDINLKFPFHVFLRNETNQTTKEINKNV